MFRFAVAAGCAQLVAGARTKEVNGELSLDDIQNNQHDTLSAVENSNSTTYCPYASGFTAHEGKCTGQFVENWANGEYANYGQDSNGHIHGLADTAYRCRQHWDCSGFYTREGVGYSHWRTGRFAVNPNPGHCCYRKVGGGSNLLEVSESEDADAEGAIVATQDEAQPQRCDAGRTCPTYDHCHPVSYGAYGCGFQCTRQGGHGSYLCNNHCAGCNYVSLLELSPSLLDMSASENVDVSDSLAKHDETNTYCPHVNGFSATPGKCIGQFIDNFANGDYAYYGQDANGGIRNAGDAAHRCSQHWDCVGFYTREGVGYSHYRSSISHVASGYPGHCCYQRSGHSLAELSAENEESNEEASHDEEEELSGSCSFESNTDYWGGQYDIIPDTTQAECCRRCSNEAHRCRLAVFFEDICYLKDEGHGSSEWSSGRVAMRPSSTGTTRRRRSPSPPPDTRRRSSYSQCTWDGPYYYEVQGHDLTHNGNLAVYPEISSHQCRDRCSEEYGCTAYVHVANADWLWNQRQQTQACYLKTGIYSYSDISRMRRRDWSSVYFKSGC